MYTELPPDPFEALLSFHRRVERCMAEFAALPSELAAHGATPDACATAAMLLHCFDVECPRRHHQEERELWPLVEAAIGGGEPLASFRALRRSLASQHREIDRAWRGLRRPLLAVAEGLPRPLDLAAIADYRTLFCTHIHAEETALHRVATAARRPLRAPRHRTVMEPPRN